MKIQNLNFKSITDYLILVSYVLKKLDKNNKEITKLLNDYLKCIVILEENISRDVYDQIVLTNDEQKMKDFIKFLKKK